MYVHDGDSFKSRPDDVSEEFYKMVDEAINNDEPLYCIGFHLPDITVNKEFTKPVYFSFATFQEADFSFATFQQQAYFSFADFNEVEFHLINFPSKYEMNRYLFSWDDGEDIIINALKEVNS